MKLGLHVAPSCFDLSYLGRFNEVTVFTKFMKYDKLSEQFVYVRLSLDREQVLGLVFCKSVDFRHSLLRRQPPIAGHRCSRIQQIKNTIHTETRSLPSSNKAGVCRTFSRL